MALSAKQHGYKKVVFLVDNVPAAIQGAQALGGLVFKAAGVGFTVHPGQPGHGRHEPAAAVGRLGRCATRWAWSAT